MVRKKYKSIRKEEEKINTIFYLMGYDLKEIQELTVLFWENRIHNPTIKMAEA